MTDPKPCRFLLIETSGHGGHVALALDDQLVGARELTLARRHARDLAPFVQSLLAEQEWEADQLDAVFVSRGPGSYTGLRVGLISAKTFAYSTGCAILTVDTFRAIAEQTSWETELVDVIADAQKGKIYVQGYHRTDSGSMHPRDELRIVPFEDWLTARDSAAWVTGPGLDKWDPRVPTDVSRADAELRTPLPESVLFGGLDRWEAGDRDDLWTVEPLYLRPSAAEEQWEGRS